MEAWSAQPRSIDPTSPPGRGCAHLGRPSQRHRRGTADGGLFSVKPILFVGQRAPGSLHSFVPPIRRLIACALRELRAMLGVFAENFRLLHAILPQGKLRACFNPQLIRRVPSKRRAILQKLFSSTHGDEQPFRNLLPLQLEVGRASQRRRRGPEDPRSFYYYQCRQ